MSTSRYNLLIKNVSILLLFCMGCKNNVSQNRPNQLQTNKNVSFNDSSFKNQNGIQLNESIAQKSLPKSDWSILNLHGQVRILQVHNYEAIKAPSGQIVKGGPTAVPIAHSFSARFNTNGFMTSQTDYDKADDKAYRILLYDYDILGRLSFIHTVFFHLEIPQLQKFKYDNKGNLAETSFFDGEYLTKQVTFTFDSQNLKISELEFRPDNKDKNTTTYKYDDRNNIIEQLDYNNLKLSFHHEYEYDKLNRQIKKACVYAWDPEYESTELYSYDSYGNIIETIFPKFNNIISRTEYIYDAQGNWVRSITYHFNGNPEMWTERKIEYY